MGAGSDAVASVNDTGTEEGTEAQDEELQKADKECEM